MEETIHCPETKTVSFVDSIKQLRSSSGRNEIKVLFFAKKFTIFQKLNEILWDVNIKYGIQYSWCNYGCNCWSPYETMNHNEEKEHNIIKFRNFGELHIFYERVDFHGRWLRNKKKRLPGLDRDMMRYYLQSRYFVSNIRSFSGKLFNQTRV